MSRGLLFDREIAAGHGCGVGVNRTADAEMSFFFTKDHDAGVVGVVAVQADGEHARVPAEQDAQAGIGAGRGVLQLKVRKAFGRVGQRRIAFVAAQCGGRLERTVRVLTEPLRRPNGDVGGGVGILLVGFFRAPDGSCAALFVRVYEFVGVKVRGKAGDEGVVVGNGCETVIIGFRTIRPCRDAHAGHENGHKQNECRKGRQGFPDFAVQTNYLLCIQR